jgi:hypothetical protein
VVAVSLPQNPKTPQDSFNNLKKYQRLKLFEVRFGPTGPLLNCDFLNFSSQ